MYVNECHKALCCFYCKYANVKSTKKLNVQRFNKPILSKNLAGSGSMKFALLPIYEAKSNVHY